MRRTHHGGGLPPGKLCQCFVSCCERHSCCHLRSGGYDMNNIPAGSVLSAQGVTSLGVTPCSLEGREIFRHVAKCIKLTRGPSTRGGLADPTCHACQHIPTSRIPRSQCGGGSPPRRWDSPPDPWSPGHPLGTAGLARRTLRPGLLVTRAPLRQSQAGQPRANVFQLCPIRKFP